MQNASQTPASTLQVKVQKLPHAEGLPLPSYATAGAAGMDLLAAEAVPLPPQGRTLIPTGLCVALPPGYEMQIRPRSGLALKHGLILPNAPGTIDEDYRGEIKIILMNMGQEIFFIERGMRIAQAIIAPVSRITWLECTNLDATERGSGGFGSTGTLSS
ncbi:MAG: dUTP diphosphatase [Acetobacter sp.]|nr:dUTP diphosphatase [Acetobacter sp.]